MTISYTLVALVMSVHASAVMTPHKAADAHKGDYAGWIYFDSGADLPVRLHIERAGDGSTRASLDLPVYDSGSLAAVVEESTEHLLRVKAANVVGFNVTVDLRSHGGGGELLGRTTWTGERSTLHGDIHLHRSAVPLPWVPMAQLPDASGVYPLSSSHSIIITRRPWGELFYTDNRSGRSGYLFADSPTTLFAGSGPYVPAEVTARVELKTNDDGQVTAIIWQENHNAPIEATRTRFITEPVRFVNAETELAGEITRLEGDDSRPGIVVIGGSDWETAAGMRGFANVFASFGFVVLTFDKRGHGESGGESVASFATIGGDVNRAAQFLASRPESHKNSVGVFGYSRAGWHIPLAASTSDAIGYAIMFVPPAVSPAEQETTRRLAELRAGGVHDPDDLDLAKEYLDAMWSFARTSEGGETYLRLRDQVDQRGWLDVLDGPATLDESEWRWSRLNMHYDPLPALRRMKCPVLAVFGGADSNVTLEENLPLMREALQEAGNERATLVVIAGADHGLRPAQTQGRPHQRQSNPPDLWPTVHRWLIERFVDSLKDGALSPESNSRHLAEH